MEEFAARPNQELYDRLVELQDVRMEERLAGLRAAYGMSAT